MGRDGSPSVLRHVLDRSCRELEERLRQGDAIGAEAFLAWYPLLANDTEAAVELIYQEFLTREELGHRPSSEEFLRRFPSWRERLDRQLVLHTILGDRLAAVGAGGNGGDWEDSPGEQSSGFGLLAPRKGSYRILREVFRGNNVIYEAIQSGTGRRVALKCIGEGDQEASEARGLLLAEARTASRLRHPNIVQIFEAGIQDDVLFLAMEFIEGQSLARWLKDARPTPTHAARIAEILARALHYAHSQGVIHRDLSPANIMLTTDGVPIITDFGLALRSGQAPRRARLGAMVGTPGYMAPEQVGSASGVTAAADIHALGAILYELLAGCAPFPTALSLDALESLIQEAAIPPRRVRREIPAALEEICLKCLEKEPSRRYQTAGALADDLARFQRGEPIRPISLLQQFARARVPRKTILLLGVFGVGGVLWQLQGLRVELSRIQSSLENQAATSRLLDAAEARTRLADEQRERLGYTLDLRRAREAIAAHHDILAADLLEGQRPWGDALDHRGFGWYALFRRLNDPLAILPDVHGASVFTVAVSPDGREFVTGDIQGTLVAWDTQTRRPRRIVHAHEAIVARLAYTPDGRRLISVCGDPRGRPGVKLWDVDSMEPLGEPVPLQADVWDLTIAADGRTVVIREHAPADRSRLWSLTPGGLTARPTRGEARLMAVSPDGQRVAALSREDVLSVEPLDMGSSASPDAASSWSLKVEGRAEAVAWRPDGKELVVATDRPSLIGITPGTGVKWTATRVPGRNVRQIRFDSSGASLIAVDTIGLSVHDADTGEIRRDCVPPGGRPLSWSAVAPDGRSALTQDKSEQVLRWDLLEGRAAPASGLKEIHPCVAAYFADSDRVILGTADGRPRLWRSGEALPRASVHQGEAWCAAFSPSGTRVASGGDDNVVRLWKVAGAGLEPEHVLEGHNATVSSLAFTPGGSHLVSGDLAGGLILWEVDTYRRVATLNPPREGVQIRCVRVAPNGRWVATAWSDGALRIWDLSSQAVQTVLSDHRDKVHGVEFSADGRWLASVGDDARVQLWDVRGVQPSKLWWYALPSPGMSVAFSPDGSMLAVGLKNGRIELRETSTGERRFTLQGHSKDVTGLVYTPDGEALISGSLDGNVQTWDPMTGQERVLLRRHKTAVHEVALSPDGTKLVSCDHGGAVWMTSAPRDAAAVARALAPRSGSEAPAPDDPPPDDERPLPLP